MGKQIHMGRWIHSRSRYVTWCRGMTNEDLTRDWFIVRTNEEWNRVTCKHCLKKRAKVLLQ